MRWGGAGPRAPWGGDGAAGAPPLTRLAACPWGIVRPGFSKHARVEARSKGKFPMFSAESIILPGGRAGEG